MIDFIQSGSIGSVADTNSKLRYVVSPLETLGDLAERRLAARHP